MEADNRFQVAVIGAGPVGLFTSSMLGMMGLSTVVFDSQPEVGGQCIALYPEKPVYGVPALPNIKAGDLVKKLYDQSLSYNSKFVLGNEVKKISKVDNLFVLETCKGHFFVNSVVIAAGFGSFTPNKIGLENEIEFEGKSLFYHVSSINDFKDDNVIILGGGNAAIDWAIELTKVAKSISVIHRRESFRCSEFTQATLEQLVKENKIKLFTPYQTKKLLGQNGILENIEISNGENTLLLPLNKLIVLFGISSNVGYIKEWGIEMKGQKISIDQSTCSTNIDGIFSVGDIVEYENKVNIIASGFGEAVKVAYSVKKFLNPTEYFQNNCQSLKGI